MMDNFSFLSYLSSSIAFFVFFIFSLKSINKHTSGLSLIIAVFLSLVWSSYTSFSLLYDEYFSITEVLALESLRNVSLFGYLLVLLTCIHYKNSYLFLIRTRYSLGIIAFSLITFAVESFPSATLFVNSLVSFDARILAHVIFSLIGLMLVEQLYRNSPKEQRWAIKFTCLGLGSLFIYDFIIYTKALLFLKLDYELWNVRGIINALIVPLLMVSMSRLKNSTKSFYLSKQMVFHSATLITAGGYLLIMSMAGYYIKHFGGEWGSLAQTIFIFLALIILFALLFSGKIRALIKVYLNKHFVHYRYDYREQWIKISSTLADLNSFSQLSSFIIQSLASIVDSTGGALWLKNEQGDYYLVEKHSLGFDGPPLIYKDNDLIKFFNHKAWVVDCYEYINEPQVYDEVDFSFWLDAQKKVWIIVPLFQQQILQGFVVLTQSQITRKLNWEDHDVLKTVGMQLANSLVLHQASEQLSVAKQFEAYNRLSAFVVHDLKNVVAQISLIVKNSEKHKRNPEFIDDSIETLENATDKMDNLIQQLKKGQKNFTKKTIDLVGILSEIIVQLSDSEPVAELKSDLQNCLIPAEPEKIKSVFTHLIQNAQQAASQRYINAIEKKADSEVVLDTPFVHVVLTQEINKTCVTICDNGVGMDDKFISERLYKPFDTTKGNAGMGIGVYEARTYVLEHSGLLSVESELNVGTSFVIELPNTLDVEEIAFQNK